MNCITFLKIKVYKIKYTAVAMLICFKIYQFPCMYSIVMYASYSLTTGFYQNSEKKIFKFNFHYSVYIFKLHFRTLIPYKF